MGVKAGEIVEALGLCEREHLGSNLLNLTHALVEDGIGIHGGLDVFSDSLLVECVAVGERPDARFGAARGSVGIAHKGGEGYIGGENVLLNGCQKIVGECLLFGESD